MLQKEYIQRMDDGGLIVGRKGEKIANHFAFYAVFQDEEAYHVMAKDGEIGTLTNCPAVDEVFVLAGRSWRVISIDEERKNIYVSQTKSSKIPSWTGDGGDIHTKVVRKLEQVLQESVIYPYLQPNAATPTATMQHSSKFASFNHTKHHFTHKLSVFDTNLGSSPARCGAYDKLIQFYSLIQCNTCSYNAAFYPKTLRFQ